MSKRDYNVTNYILLLSNMVLSQEHYYIKGPIREVIIHKLKKLDTNPP